MTGYQIGPETFMTVSCQVFDAEGEAASEAEVVAAVFGLGRFFPEVERSLEGKVEGDSVEITLPPGKAFGKRKAEGVLEVDRGDFPEDVAPGDRFDVENDDGGMLVLHVLDVQDDLVVVDTNHPLADQEVKFVVKVLEVRPASLDEITAAEAEMAEDIEFFEPKMPILSPESLVRGKTEG